MPVDPISSANAAVAQITGVIRQAARAVGTSFSYLLATAKVESNFDPKAKATTSSASGLFQFIEQTWLSTMKDAGPALGYGRYAEAISRGPGGRLTVADPTMRSTILALRKDPAANAAMAGAFTQNNANILSNRLGRRPTEGELYIAHFLGAAGAVKLINAAGKSPTSAAELFPQAANANRSIFYNKAGSARTASEVYATLVSRYDVARAGTAEYSRIAAAAPPTRNVAAHVPDPASTTEVFAAATTRPERAGEAAPVFHALFHTAERNGPVAARITNLWGLGGTNASTENQGTVGFFRDAQPDTSTSKS